MRWIGRPFGYVLWGLLIGLCAGVVAMKLSDAAGLDALLLAIGGALLGYGVERFAMRRR